jgi:Bacterial protein of unknown function (DUF839)
VKRLTKFAGALVAGATASVLAIGPVSADIAPVKPYTVPLSNEYEIRPLLSVGDTVPETGNPGQEYRMVGIPDGLGAGLERRAATLHMNHELTQPTTSEPEVGRPANRGALVSKYSLSSRGMVSGERAYDAVFQENTLVGPAPTTANATAAFSRFCSGNFAGREYGFDRGIYFTGEEEATAATFDGKGGQTVAIFDNEVHALPKFGHFAKENTLPQPRSDSKTVMMTLEDGPSGPDSQLYMYVGTKQPSGSVLSRNGLDNGKLYTFVSDDPAKNSETTFLNGSITGHWVEVPGAEALTADQLETASDAVGATGFVRIEDGAFSKRNRNDFFFVTTGGNAPAGNELGRLYHLRLGADPLAPATLEIVYNADTVIAGGGDTAISPDNVDTSRNQLMINEDGTTQSRAVMAQKGRDGSIWRFNLVGGGGGQTVDGDSATRVAELDPPGRDGVPVGPGVWETSGIISLGGVFGNNFWMFDVQAHPPTTAPAPGTVEDGQLLLMRRVSGDD